MATSPIPWETGQEKTRAAAVRPLPVRVGGRQLSVLKQRVSHLSQQVKVLPCKYSSPQAMVIMFSRIGYFYLLLISSGCSLYSCNGHKCVGLVLDIWTFITWSLCYIVHHFLIPKCLKFVLLQFLLLFSFSMFCLWKSTEKTAKQRLLWTQNHSQNVQTVNSCECEACMWLFIEFR